MLPSLALDQSDSTAKARPAAVFPEGIVSPILLIAMLAVAGRCIDQANWDLLVIPLTLVAVVATVFGCITAKLLIDDAISHGVSMLLAVVVVAGLVIVRSDDLGVGLRARPRELGRLILDWYFGRPVPVETESYLVSLLMGLAIWLVGYLAAWSLFRLGWVYVAIVLPAFLILINLGSRDDAESWWLGVYAVLAVILLARINLWMRQREWRRHGLTSPAGLAGRFLVIGTVVALLATSFAWQSPEAMSQRALQPFIDDLGQRIESAQGSLDDLVDRVTGTGTGSSLDAGAFTSFDQAFSIGGPLELSDEPQAIVFADGAPYLTAQHYDAYTGRGWNSTTEGTFVAEGADGRNYAPEMTFAPNQPVPLGPSATGARGTTTLEILPLGPMGGRVLTVNTHQSSSIPTSVRMSWIQLDGEVFAVTDGSIEDIPRDLAGLVALLSRADLSGPDGGHGPAATDDDLNQDIESERAQLSQRFLEVTWTAEGGGLQTITVSGQIPVYDDVEAVFYRDSSDVEARYTILARPSQASPDDLRAAGVEYPGWVTDRYLQLPETITPRTVNLVNQLTAGLDNPFDQAEAIEAYIRSAIIYDESVTEPPDGADIVDYLLFERERGYCEYTATAMTVLLRAIGIPARVAVGFYPGAYDASVGGFLYEQRNAHAWTEAYVPGYGWIPFEPTSSQPLIDEGAGSPDEESVEEDALPTETPVEPTEPSAEASPAALDGDTPQSQVPQAVATGGGGLPAFVVPSLVAMSVLAVGALALWLAWAVPLRHLTPAGSLYHRVRRVGAWLGIRSGASSTPEEFGRAFAEKLPVARSDVYRIVSAYEMDTYGPSGDDARQVRGAQEAWDAIRRRLPGWMVRRR